MTVRRLVKFYEEIGNTEGPSVSGIIPVSCVVAGGLTRNAGEMKLEEEPNKFAILASYDEDGKPLTEPNECKQSEKSKSLSTLALTERRDHNLTNHQDVNSIEHLDETKLNKNDFNNIDAADGGLNNFNYSSKKKHKKKKKKNKQNGSIDIEEKHDEDDKTVKCLYYTLMCCECTIS